jgi:poly(A) polymerase
LKALKNARKSHKPQELLKTGSSSPVELINSAIMAARYGIDPGPAPVFTGPEPKAEVQRLLLEAILVSEWPSQGLEYLKASGFVAACWPSLALLDDVGQSKEFHPEGNVWRHTMETFQYRKPEGGAFDFRLSLGLLLHDLGKPLAAAEGGRRFNGHAEIGARAARRFLEGLEFPEELIEDIFYLVKNHMMPAALPRLPIIRSGDVMASPLFPRLMELYRCDESSSFKGLEGYYQSAARYKAFLRNRRNPYRSAEQGW